MPPKLTYEYVRKYIEKAGDKLISTEYVNTLTKLVIECHKCETEYEQTFAAYKAGNRHQKCPEKEHINPLIAYNATRSVTYVTKTCPACNNEFTVTKAHKNLVTCDQECLKLLYKQKSEAGYFKNIGSAGGKVSAAVQVRRSKNEILFAALCEKYFIYDEVVCNEPMFDGWDADVTLKKLKIAILWNGIWHYKQVRKDHNLEHVQSRDRIKKKIIEKLGFIPYIIKDMGGFDQQFVIREFIKLRKFVYFT